MKIIVLPRPSNDNSCQHYGMFSLVFLSVFLIHVCIHMFLYNSHPLLNVFSEHHSTHFPENTSGGHLSNIPSNQMTVSI